MLSDNITNHVACDMVELVFKICPLQTDNAIIHLFDFVVAVFEHMILALFHLLDLFELLENRSTNLVPLNLRQHRGQSRFEPIRVCLNIYIHSLQLSIDMALEI